MSGMAKADRIRHHATRRCAVAMTLPPLSELFPDEDYGFHLRVKLGPPADFFAPTAERDRILAERRRWLEADPARHAFCLPEGAPLLEECIALADAWNSLPANCTVHGTFADAGKRCEALGREWEADFLLLAPDAAGEMVLRAGCVCFPSSWALEEKIGQPVTVIHEPVPGLNASLGTTINTFLRKLRPGVAFLRWNWGLSRGVEWNMHPARNLPRLTPPLRADEVFVRLEYQALVALPASRGVLFGIRLAVFPLAEVKADAAARKGLQRALATMPEAVARYKGLWAARMELLRLLEA
jgi:hypothetical protein